MIIREATGDDREAILDIVLRAFRQANGDGQEEVEIVQDTWRRHAAPEGLELVAEDDGVVVGHVLAAVGDLDGDRAIGVAPLSVAPERHGQGIGSALMRDVLRRAENDGWPFVLLLGAPEYYRRFGFEPASRFGLTYAPAGPDSPHFMLRLLSEPPAPRHADFVYCWERPEPVGIEAVRALASTLPRSYEVLVRDRVKFRVGRIVWLAFSRDEQVMGFAFPKEQRDGLIASDPVKFLLPPKSDLRYNWVCVRLAHLQPDEMTELVLDAWRMVVPKSVAAGHLGS